MPAAPMPIGPPSSFGPPPVATSSASLAAPTIRVEEALAGDEDEMVEPVLEPSHTAINPDTIRLVYKTTDKEVGSAHAREHQETTGWRPRVAPTNGRASQSPC